MTTTNCIDGLACPRCGNADRLLVTASARMIVTDDGSDMAHGCEPSWDDASPATCPRCGYDGMLGDFRIPDGLPPDPEGMNDDRARWAEVALAAFRSETGPDREDAVGDLLGDLMHWCDRAGFDFELALDRARLHYEAETLLATEPTTHQPELGADQ